MLMFPEGGFLTLTYRSRASRFSERELNTHLLVAFCSHRCEVTSNSTQVFLLIKKIIAHIIL